MNTPPDRIAAVIRRRGLAGIYLLAGDEALLVLEAADAVRRAARADGYDEREVLHVQPGFDWAQLAAAGDSLSLFAQKRIIELHLPDAGPGKDGGAALTDFAANPPADTLLLIIATPLPAKQRHAAWYKKLDAAGVTSFAWPIDAGELPQWIARRAASRQLDLTREAVDVLAERTEGHLLAAAQEIDRLALLFADQRVDAEAMLAVAADSARFDMFDLGNKALAGDAAGVIRTAQRLREEGIDPVPILWALVRDLRGLLAIQAGDKPGGPMPPQRRRLLDAAAKRLSRARLQRLLWLAAHADQVNKGAARGRPWAELVTLSLGMAGVRPPRHRIAGITD